MSNIKDIKHNLKLFQDVVVSEKYSSYAKMMPKISGDFCFENFYKKLQNPNPLNLRNTLSVFFEKNQPKKEPNKNLHIFNVSKFEEYLKNQTNKNNTHKKPYKHTINERTMINLQKLKKYKKQKLDALPLHMYNPNYSLVMERVPSYVFSPMRKEKSLLEVNHKDNANAKPSVGLYKSQRETSQLSNHQVFSSSIRLKTKRLPKLGFNSKSCLSNSLSNSSLDTNHNNSLISLSAEKDKKEKKLKESKSVKIFSVNRLSPKNKAPDFKHMGRERSVFYPEKTKKYDYYCSGPSVGQYTPNYDSVLKASRKIVFDYVRPTPSKKYLIQKLWKSYGGLGSEYKLVDLPCKE